jgi:hypothetical protein
MCTITIYNSRRTTNGHQTPPQLATLNLSDEDDVA